MVKRKSGFHATKVENTENGMEIMNTLLIGKTMEKN